MCVGNKVGCCLISITTSAPPASLLCRLPRNNIFATKVFNDPLYYNLKESKLLGDGLTLGYNTYINTRSGSVANTENRYAQAAEKTDIRKQHKRIAWRGKKPQGNSRSCFQEMWCNKNNERLFKKRETKILLIEGTVTTLYRTKDPYLRSTSTSMNVYTNINTKSLEQFICLFF